MKYQKIINLLDDTPNQLSNYQYNKSVISYQSTEIYNANSDIRVKTVMLKSTLCDYSDSYILVKGRITITGAGSDAAIRQADERNKGIIFKTCARYIYCNSEKINTKIIQKC